MFKPVIISVLASIVSVQCGIVLTPAVRKLVYEKVVESHGNNVVHAAAPLVAVAPTLRYANVALVQQHHHHPVAHPIVQPAEKTSLISEGTAEAHGHRVIHGANTLFAAATPSGTVESLVPTIAAAREVAAPIYYSAPVPLLAEKTVSSYGHVVRHIA